ncbi:MAG: hypothetical protein NT159_22145 [Proteobacteria bacterium]|nr:hypothetical protein [Pseudomonadota bacterium]
MTIIRSLARYHVRWKIALIFDEVEQKPTFHGRTHDLTLVGTGMLTHRDVFTDSPVVVLLAIPPLHRNGRQKVIEIRAKQVYSVYSGETFCFRLGLEFISFKGDGLEILIEGLSHRNPLISLPDYDPVPTAFVDIEHELEKRLTPKGKPALVRT